MASLIFFFSIIGWIFIFIAKRSYRYKGVVILQFIIGASILELAWLHALINIVLMIMAVGDVTNWTINTVLGFGLCAYNAFMLWCLHNESLSTKEIFKQAFSDNLTKNALNESANPRLSLINKGVSKHQWLKPFRFKTKQMLTHKDIAYGDHPQQTLRVYEPENNRDTPMPVMLQIHGGGWMLGYSEHQALPLRDKLVSAGWIFVVINYRLSPDAKFPDPLIDCKQALKWIQEHIENYGGDPNFVICTGGSAGGHLASLLALTDNKYKEKLQPGFETSTLPNIRACIPFYGVYDFTDKYNHRQSVPLEAFLEKNIMPSSMKTDKAIWQLASPIHQLHEDRPPFLVIQGDLDTLAFAEEAQSFVKDAKAVSKNLCLYVEIPYAQHAFDLFYSPHCLEAIKAAHKFSEIIYHDYLRVEFTD